VTIKGHTSECYSDLEVGCMCGLEDTQVTVTAYLYRSGTFYTFGPIPLVEVDAWIAKHMADEKEWDEPSVRILNPPKTITSGDYQAFG
jgi:hypothetical protein